MSQIEWFKNRFKDISGIWINEKNGSVFTTVKLKNGTTATVSHTLDVSAVNELGMLWAYVKAVEKFFGRIGQKTLSNIPIPAPAYVPMPCCAPPRPAVAKPRNSSNFY